MIEQQPSEMVLRMARAMFDREWGGLGNDKLFEADEGYWVPAAIAALKALREPNEKMVQATWDLVWANRAPKIVGQAMSGSASELWRTLIDTALGDDK